MIAARIRVAGIAIFAASAWLVGAVSAQTQTPTTVNIKLEDSTSMPGMNDMKMETDRAMVPAGKVTLRATNESKQLIHEVLVVKDDGKPLPYNSGAGKLIESQLNKLGEVSDIKPGKSDYRTFTLAPGNYILICNQPMHFKMGMYARLTVGAATAAGGTTTTPPATTEVAMPAGEDAEGS
ncbi:MAG TPA: plastocyanin/azurin family copper-binding protein [Stellaceae bacterium]|jgi:uncharacterized cupredoxin-like copper-binding protein|nr:plastocyanin/azurin family copper-binding protein [Stellaceae bacterium]